MAGPIQVWPGNCCDRISPMLTANREGGLKRSNIPQPEARKKRGRKTNNTENAENSGRPTHTRTYTSRVYFPPMFMDLWMEKAAGKKMEAEISFVPCFSNAAAFFSFYFIVFSNRPNERENGGVLFHGVEGRHAVHTVYICYRTSEQNERCI